MMKGLIKRFIEFLAPDDGGFPGALSGSYDIRGDRLVGQVIAELPASRKAIEVQVLRQGKLVASYRTVPVGDGRAQNFELPMEGLLTGADLVRETFDLKAANTRGDSGPLLLEGSTRLELIREHLGIPVENVFDLDMTRGGNAAGFLGKGWSGTENTFTWTENDDSYVTFPTPAVRGLHLLRMRAGAFINDMSRRQLLELSINGEEFAAFIQDDAAVEYREFKLDGALFGSQPNCMLRLHHPYAGKPSDHSKSGDARRLAFSFRRLTLARVLKLPQ
jgi:hypothetical protein